MCSWGNVGWMDLGNWNFENEERRVWIWSIRVLVFFLIVFLEVICRIIGRKEILGWIIYYLIRKKGFVRIRVMCLKW